MRTNKFLSLILCFVCCQLSAHKFGGSDSYCGVPIDAYSPASKVVIATSPIQDPGYYREKVNKYGCPYHPIISLISQAGASYTLGETPEFLSLMSPATSFNIQWQFHHAFGLRTGFGIGQGKGAIVAPEQYIYSFPFLQHNSCVVMDLANLIGGFKQNRIVHPYMLAGVGVAYGLSNREAEPYMFELAYYWEHYFFTFACWGLGVDFKLNDVISLGVESNSNLFPDEFNSKKEEESPRDSQFNLLFSISFHLGKRYL